MPVHLELRQALMRQYFRRSYWFQRLPVAQRLLLVLLPALSLLGLLLMYFNHPSTNSMAVISDRPVNVEFFVMSKCPDAHKCETLFAPALLKLSSIINFTLSFIAYESGSKEIECMHGAEECLGNKQQLCVQHLYPQTTFIRFLQCQAKHIDNIPDNGKQCAQDVADGRLKWSEVDTCVKSSKANELFHRSLERTRAASAKKSCTMHLNGKFWCMHDGSWYGCSDGHDEKSFIKAICLRYSGPKKPDECSTLN